MSLKSDAIMILFSGFVQETRRFCIEVNHICQQGVKIMPGRDETGPEGQGSGTGRRRGGCVSGKNVTDKDQKRDRRVRQGRSGGRGNGQRQGRIKRQDRGGRK